MFAFSNDTKHKKKLKKKSEQKKEKGSHWADPGQDQPSNPSLLSLSLTGRTHLPDSSPTSPPISLG
jgi:hypothetical protein